MRAVGTIGHWGTGDVELSISCADELEAAKPLLQRAYLGRGPVS